MTTQEKDNRSAIKRIMDQDFGPRRPPYRKAKPNYTRFHDQGILDRHRVMGAVCYATDIDILLCEYYEDTPVAIIELKESRSTTFGDMEISAHRAGRQLANRASLPYLHVKYERLDPWGMKWTIASGNGWGDRLVGPNPIEMNDKEFLIFMHRLRKFEPDQEYLGKVLDDLRVFDEEEKRAARSKQSPIKPRGG